MAVGQALARPKDLLELVEVISGLEGHNVRTIMPTM
jgi:hypothetical protein